MGLALLAWTPVGWVLATAGGVPSLAVAGGAATVVLATVPDVDTVALGVEHRGPTHSLVFALATAVLAACAGFWIGSVPGLGAAVGGTGHAGVPLRFAVAGVAGAAGGIAVLSHLAGDLLTPMGVAPYWPVSARRYSLDVARSKSRTLNYASLLVGVLAAVVAVVGAAGGGAP